MNIAMISIGTPKKNGKGYEILLYHRIKHLLGQGDKIILFILGSKKAYDHDLKELCDFSDNNLTIEYFNNNKLTIIKNIITTIFFTRLPLQVGLCYNNALVKRLIDLDRNEETEIIITNLIRPFECVPRHLKIPLALDVLDSMTLNFSRRVDNEIFFLKKFLLNLELRRLRRYEENLSKDILVFVVAQKDLSYFLVNEKYCLELGIEYSAQHKSAQINFNKYVFSGNMKYGPNLDAYNYLKDQIWRTIRSVNPCAELYVVGRNSDNLPNNDDSIHLVGAVKNMSEYLNGADIAIAPMRQGSGMQFKILEALAVGLPVITTTMGLGSIKAEKEKDIFIFDDVIELKQILKKINDVGDRSLERQNFIKTNHSWYEVNRRFRSYIKNTIKNRNKGR